MRASGTASRPRARSPPKGSRAFRACSGGTTGDLTWSVDHLPGAGDRCGL